jgi:hypothetical protein
MGAMSMADGKFEISRRPDWDLHRKAMDDGLEAVEKPGGWL